VFFPSKYSRGARGVSFLPANISLGSNALNSAGKLLKPDQPDLSKVASPVRMVRGRVYPQLLLTFTSLDPAANALLIEGSFGRPPSLLSPGPTYERHDIQHNDTQHKGIQHNGLI
jgi:hypothetical protein